MLIGDFDMGDEGKSKKQLVKELEDARKRIAELEGKRQFNRILTMGYYSGSRVFCFC